MARRLSNAHNILHRLSHREISKSRPNTHLHSSRKLYENVCPDSTVSDVVCPPILMRKFTSDGKYLISFSLSLQNLVLYQFVGHEACTMGDPDQMMDESSPASSFSNKFDNYFTRMYESPLAVAPEVLCKDFCLMANKQQFIVLASSTPTALRDSSGVPASSPEFRNENYTFYLVRLEDGKELDRITFTHDFIFLQHHAGVSLYEDMFAVLSIRTQTIHIFQIKPSGKFVPVHSVGQFCYDDDALVVAQQQEAEERFLRENSAEHPQPAPVHMPPPVMLPPDAAIPSTGAPLPQQRASTPSFAGREFPSGPMSGIKQRLLSFLHRQAKMSPEPQAMRSFFASFDQYANLMLWRMQLLDDKHVLIKFGSLDVIMGSRLSYDSSTHTALFAVYNIQTTEIVGVFTNTSEHLFQQFEQFCDFFRASVSAPSYGSSSSNNEIVREQLRRQIHALATAKSNRGAAVRRMLSCLPMGPQSQHESPYLDQAMFAYDEKAISFADRPKPCFDQPVKFHSRRTGQLRFKLFTGPARFDRPMSKRFASYVFHPVLPFAISMQHAGVASPVVNFHFRC